MLDRGRDALFSMVVRGPELRRWTIPAALALTLALASAALTGHAQDRSTVLRVLRESRDFRARARAAQALGASADPAMASALAVALSDAEPAVRAAAAEGLGRLGNPEALPALRRALSDSSPEVRAAAQAAIRGLGASAAAAAPVPHDPLRMPSIEVLPPAREFDWRTVRYVVVLGQMQNRSGFASERLDRMLVSEVHRHLVGLRGVATLPEGAHPDADREIERRQLPRMRLEGSISRVHRQVAGRDLSVRCEVALMLLEEPGRNIRAALNGAATGSERAASLRAQQEVRLAERALAGAVRSAMSGAARAITGSSAR